MSLINVKITKHIFFLGHIGTIKHYFKWLDTVERFFFIPILCSCFSGFLKNRQKWNITNVKLKSKKKVNRENNTARKLNFQNNAGEKQGAKNTRSTIPRKKSYPFFANTIGFQTPLKRVFFPHEHKNVSWR